MNATDGADIGRLMREFPELAANNEARRTLAWLQAKIAADPSLDHDWSGVCARMQHINERTGILRTDLPDYDLWLCKRANPEPAGETTGALLTGEKPWTAQIWQPPSDWRCWPTFGVETEDWIADARPRRTRALDAASLPAYAGDASTERARASEILVKLATAGPLGVMLFTQAGAWIDIALGRLGRMLQGGPHDVDPKVLTTDLALEVIGEHSFMRADMMEDSLLILYGSVRRPDGRGLYADPSPRGQSHEWRDYFRALGADLDKEHVLAAVQLAALLLRSESVWSALASTRAVASELLQEAPAREDSADAERSATEALDVIACVRRRWLLAARALAWLELSLEREAQFHVLRPADLACFAVASLLPVFPRPLMVVSHRSCDMKEALVASKAWRSNEVLIDATFRPEWQTNRAMVWSLFAATPVICKIKSARYEASRWCNREAEMFDHLCEYADFMHQRFFFEIEPAEAAIVERPARSSPDTHRLLPGARGADNPPFELTRWKSWQGAMVRAGAAAKLLHRTFLLNDPEQASAMTNKLLAMMADETRPLPPEPMLGFDDIWRRLAEGLRADAKFIDLKLPLVSVPEPRKTFLGIGAKKEPVDDMVAEAEHWFNRHGPRMPDPSGADIDVCDLLAALDWRDHLEHFLRAHTQDTLLRNQAAFIDLRDVTKEEWINDPGWTVARGLIFLRLPYPLLIRQRADQGVEDWPMIRNLDLPIFTQHTPDQSVPQSEVFFSLGGPWPAAYVNAITPALTIHPFLYEAAYRASKEGDDPVYMRAEKGIDSILPATGSFPSFSEWMRTRKGDGKEGA